MEASTQPNSDRKIVRSDFELLVSYGRRNWWVVLASMAVGILLGLLYLAAAKPGYRATAVMLIQPQSSQPSNREAAPATPELVRSQMEVLKSQPVLDAAVRQMRLDHDPEFTKSAPDGASAAVRSASAREELNSKLTVENDGRSYTLSVTAKSGSPDKAARIANTVAQTYIDAQRAQKVKMVETTRSNLGRRLADLRAETYAAEQAAEAYRIRSGLVPLSSVPEDSESYAAATPASREIIEMSKEHAGLAARRAEARAKYLAQQSAISRGRGDSTEEVLSSLVVSELRQQEAQLASQESELLARYRPDHPLVRPVQAQLGEVRRNISAEVARIHRSVASSAIASDRAYEGGDRFMNQLAGRRSRDLQASTKLTQLQREAMLKRDTYEEFAAQMQRAAEQAGLQLPDVLLVSPASPPVRTSGPKALIVLLAAAVVGLFIGLLIGLVRSMRAERRIVQHDRVVRTA